MNTSNLTSNSAGVGLLAAIVASLCCITPVLALLGGISGIAATFSWIEPFRPYLIVLTVVVLGFAWYVKLRPVREEADCYCEADKPSFLQSKIFLGVATVIAAIMLSFPGYAHIFYSTPDPNAGLINFQDSTRQVTVNVKGMTCAGCEAHIENAVAQLEGVKTVDASFANGTALVEFLTGEVKESEIIQAINKTGYKVMDKGQSETSTTNVQTQDNLSFFKVPLVCAAASHLGCGSRSKPVLLEFEKSDFVNEAWLNKQGDVMAIVWKKGTGLGTQREIVTRIFTKHQVNASELLMNDYAENYRSFSSGKGWFKGEDVNMLSKEEAGIFAERFMQVIKQKTELSSTDEDKLREKATTDMYDFFLNFKSMDELSNPDSYKKIIRDLIKYGESLIGKGNMPSVDELWTACSYAAKSCSHEGCTGGSCKIPKG